MKPTRIISSSFSLTFSFFIVLALCMSSCGLYGKYQPLHPEADSITTPAYTAIFTDTQLQQLIDCALQQNLDLKMAHERVAQADARLLGAKLAYVPSIGVSAQGDLGSRSDVYSGQSYLIGAQADWQFDIFGRLYNQMKMAEADRLSAQDAEQLYRTELIASVARNYYLLLMLDAEIITVDSIGRTFLASLDALKAMKQAGVCDEAAVAQYEGNYYAVLAQSRQLQLERHKTENAIRLLLASPDTVISRSTLRQNTQSYALQDIPLSAVLTRPDVRMAENTLRRTHYGVQLGRANCCPNISLSGLLGFNGSIIWSATGSLLQPLFNSGRNIAELRGAKAAQREAELNYQSVLMNAGVQVNNAMMARRVYNDQVIDLERQVQAFERAYDAAATKFRLGQGSYLESLMALQQLLNARNALIGNYSQILLAQVDLYLALGGGATPHNE